MINRVTHLEKNSKKKQ